MKPTDGILESVGGFTVPYIERPEHPEYQYNSCQTALWNLCLKLKPRYILDIGTMGGTSAQLAARYIEEHQGGIGRVVTLDVVKPIKPIDNPLITQVQVYPYTTHGLEQYTWVEEAGLRKDWKKHLPTAMADNWAEVNSALKDAGAHRFDLAYVDGDHSEIGLWFDLAMVHLLVKYPCYALLDDVYMNGVPAGRLYRGLLSHLFNHYDFDGDGWENFKETRPGILGMPRMALIWDKPELTHTNTGGELT